MLLDSGDRNWSQVAYQFSHELGHVLCGDLSLELPQRWFEEAFCESVSLWTMERMGVSWKTDPPYGNWKSYAPKLTDYVCEVRKRVASPESLSEWFEAHREHLDQEPCDRNMNLVLAKRLADEANEDPALYQSFYYLRRGGHDTPVDSMEWLLANWIEHCPEELRFAPRAVAEMLKVTPRK